MSYIGKPPAEHFTSFATQTFSVSATTSYTLDHGVANENEIALFVNNVRQQPGSGKAYTATGTALTLSAATATTDTMYCIFLGRALQTVTPATNSITAAMVGNDLISGKTALGAEPADTDEFLVSDAGTLKRVDYSYIKGGGITEADQWRLTSDQAGNITTLNAWERNDTTGATYIGTGLTNSSGIFSFASTGKYWISFVGSLLLEGADVNCEFVLQITSDNSNYITAAKGVVGSQSNPDDVRGSCSNSFLLDVTNTSNDKFKFATSSFNNGTSLIGTSTYNHTSFTVIRLGDT